MEIRLIEYADTVGACWVDWGGGCELAGWLGGSAPGMPGGRSVGALIAAWVVVLCCGGFGFGSLGLAGDATRVMGLGRVSVHTRVC